MLWLWRSQPLSADRKVGHGEKKVENHCSLSNHEVAGLIMRCADSL